MSFTKILRTFRIGKFRYLKGTDLQGNHYFEYPSTVESARARRVIEHSVDRHLSEHANTQLSAQWESWLRHTRLNPPTLEELEKDRIRQITTLENAKRLDKQYLLEKQQKGQAQALLSDKKHLSRPESSEAELARKRREMTKSPLEDFITVQKDDNYKPQEWEPRSRR